MIDKYETKIAALTNENSRLKQKPSPLKDVVSRKERSRSKSPFKVQVQDELMSPIKLFKGVDQMQTAKSTMFTPNKVGGLNDGPRFASVLAKYQGGDEDNNFPIELINPEPVEDSHRKSRFAAKSNIKKQREE